MNLGTLKINNDQFVIQIFGSEYCIYRVGHNLTFSFGEILNYKKNKGKKVSIYNPLFKKELSKHLNNYLTAIARFQKLEIFT